jgi:hypothetical protein
VLGRAEAEGQTIIIARDRFDEGFADGVYPINDV